MNLGTGLVLGCLASWSLVSVTLLPDRAWDIFLGMISPLAVGLATLWKVRRLFPQQAVRLTRFMAGAFLGKMVWYGLYVGLAVKWLSVEPVVFIVSFTIYFVVLHLSEALYLRALFRRNAHS